MSKYDLLKDEIISLIDKGYSYLGMAKELNVDKGSLRKWCAKNNLKTSHTALQNKKDKPNNYKNIIGMRFGRLVALEEHREIINGHYRYHIKCQCDCGNVKVIEKSNLLNKNTKSCGCLAREIASEKSFLGNGVAGFNETYYAYKRGAANRGYSFELTKEQFKEIATQPCIYCGESLTQTKRRNRNTIAKSEFSYTGIDRYDNTKGYTIENSVPCCQVCNRIKTNMTIEKMEEQLNKIMARKDIWKNKG